MHAEVNKLLTETSGPILAEQARKLMGPLPNKREDETRMRVEEWLEGRARLAKYGPHCETQMLSRLQRYPKC